MDTTNVNNCFPLDLRPFSSDLNPKKKRSTSKLLRVDPPNPNPIPKANMTMPCTECGKTFWSSKALFGHMRCHPERQWRGIKPPPNFRPPPALTEEDHEVAASLLILANQGTEYSNSGGYRFECSSCKKVFGSHQALGGHRASHKNVKGCYANTKKEEEEEEEEEEEGCCKYKCSVCFRVFSTGQALGGHKRCHWDKMDIASTGFHFDFNLNFPAAQNHHPSNSSYSSGLPDLDLRLGL